MEYNGEIWLEIGKKESGGQESYIEKQFYKLPLQVMTPFYQDDDGTVFLYLLNPSGGVLDYDNFKIEVTVKTGAKAWIGTPSATKIYKRRDENAPAARQKNLFHLEKGSVLEYCPDEIIPYADSMFSQENHFYLSKDSMLLTWDILSAGRALRGEVFQFERYASQTFLYMDGKPVIVDKMVIDPRETDIRNLQCMRGYVYAATIYAYAGACDETLAERLAEECAVYEDGILGVSLVTEKLLVIKILGNHAYAVFEEMHRVWDILRGNILGKEAVRIRKF